MEKNSFHKSVMLREVLEALHIKNPVRNAKQSFAGRPARNVKKNVAGRQARYIDATLGLGGHTESIVKSGGTVLGIDADTESLELAKKHLSKACPPSLLRKAGSYTLVHGNFKDIKKLSERSGFNHVEGILFDLGTSFVQLTSKTRGFSFGEKDADLDMRLDKENQMVKASDLLNGLSKNNLQMLFSVVLPYKIAKSLAGKVEEVRNVKKFEKVGDFVSLIEELNFKKRKTNTATLPFLALRIAVNSELDNLKSALFQAMDLLKTGGRLVFISFHSGEDRIVKNFYKRMDSENLAKIITKKPIKPTLQEIAANPSARSAKLRILEKI